MPIPSSKNCRVKELRMPYPGSQYPVRPRITYGIKWNLESIRDSTDPDIRLFSWLIGVPPGALVQNQIGNGNLHHVAASLPNESSIEPFTPELISDEQQQQQQPQQQLTFHNPVPLQQEIKIEPVASEHVDARQQPAVFNPVPVHKEIHIEPITSSKVADAQRPRFNNSAPSHKKMRVESSTSSNVTTQQQTPVNNSAPSHKKIRIETFKLSTVTAQKQPPFNNAVSSQKKIWIESFASPKLIAQQQLPLNNPVSLQKEVVIEPITSAPAAAQQQTPFNNPVASQQQIKIETFTSSTVTAQQKSPSPLNNPVPAQMQIKIEPIASSNVAAQQQLQFKNPVQLQKEIKTEPFASSSVAAQQQLQFNNPVQLQKENKIEPFASSNIAAQEQMQLNNPVQLQKEIKIEPITFTQVAAQQHSLFTSTIQLPDGAKIVPLQITASQQPQYISPTGWRPISSNSNLPLRPAHMSLEHGNPSATRNLLVRPHVRPPIPTNMPIPIRCNERRPDIEITRVLRPAVPGILNRQGRSPLASTHQSSIFITTFGSGNGYSIAQAQNPLEMAPPVKSPAQSVIPPTKAAQKAPRKLKHLVKAPIPTSVLSGDPPNLTQPQSNTSSIQETVHTTDQQNRPSVIALVEQAQPQNASLLVHRCPVVGCNKYFASPQTIDMHFDQHVPAAANNTPGKNMINCPTCFKSLRKRSLYHHINIFHPTGEITCSFCKNLFSNKSSLDDHVALCHNGKRKFNCDKCDKGYIRKHTLDLHAN